MTRYIDANALMEYCSNQKSKTISNNDIARFPTIEKCGNTHYSKPTDLIRRADAEAFVCMERCGEYRKDCPAQTCPTIERFDNIPSADRPSGEWKIYTLKEKHFECDQCGKVEDRPTHYCPNCGAKMGDGSDV